MPDFDPRIAFKTFIQRLKIAKASTAIDNHRLPAGAPMYYYCDSCGIFLTTMPELHTSAAPSHCQACKALIPMGLDVQFKQMIKDHDLDALTPEVIETIYKEAGL